MSKQQQPKKPSFFVKMFMDDNDINEKSIVGFGSFLMMVVCLGVDLWTGFHGQQMPINEFIYDGFLWICLGAFGIASVDKYLTSKNKNENNNGNPEEGI
jgi:hypothetical protein